MADATATSATLSMKDIARIVGTSKATVSRVLSGQPNVSAELHERVMAVVRETGYMVNASASALGTRRGSAFPCFRHGMIGVLFCRVRDGATLSYIRQEIYDGILEAASEMGLGVTTWRLSNEEYTTGILRSQFRTPVDGVLVNPASEMDLSQLSRIAPMVFFGSRPSATCDVPTVESHNAQGISGLLQHLAGLGHRRFAFVAHTLSHLPFRERADHFEKQVAAQGWEGRVVCAGADLKAYAAAFAAEAPERRPTALLCTADTEAAGLLREFAALGVRVPTDVSITGYDGYPWGVNTYPPLTSWRPDWHTMGRVALRLLLDVIQEKRGPVITLVGGELLCRQSTGRAPGFAAAP